MINQIIASLLALMLSVVLHGCSKQEIPQKRILPNTSKYDVQITSIDIERLRNEKIFVVFRSSESSTGIQSERYDAGLVISHTYSFVGLSEEELISLLGSPGKRSNEVVDPLPGIRIRYELTYYCRKDIKEYQLIFTFDEEKPRRIVSQIGLTNDL